MAHISMSQIEEFNENGYLIIDSGVDESVIDSIVTEIDHHYNRDTVVDGFYSHDTRIQDAWHFNEKVRQVATMPGILQTLQQLYNNKPLPFQTLNFPIGTQQKPHSDSVHFSSVPHGLMAGVWIAYEDIDESNGALQYFPGSHKLPYYDMRDVGVAEGYENYGHYELFLEKVIAENGLKREVGCLRKGQALIWHANLFHGGSEQIDKSRSRHSQVTHYYFEGCQYYTPMLSSEEKLFYRNPDWIPLEPLTDFQKSKFSLKLRKYNNICRQPDLFYHLAKRIKA